VNKTLRSLDHISNNTTDISREVATLVGITGSSGASFLAGLRTDAEKILSILMENEKANHELSTAVGRVTHTIGDLSVFVGDIEEVGAEIELIALNSQIKAAKTGPEGAALGVLAEAVRNLSDRSRMQTAAVSETLANVSSSAERLDKNHMGNSEVVEVNKMVDQLTTLLDSFVAMDERVLVLTRRMEQMGKDLAGG